MLIDETDYKDALPISVGFTFSKLQPDIRRAELKYLKPILGKDLYSILEGNYTLGTLTQDETELIGYVHPAVAHLSMGLYAPKGNVFVNDNGIQAMHGAEYKPAFQWQLDEFEESMCENGYDALDELIEYLEEVADYDFPDWLLSEGCTLVRRNFVNTAHHFTAYVPKVRGSRYLFLQLRPIMDRVELEMKRSILGKELYEALKMEIRDDDVSEENAEILEYLEPAVCHLSWAAALYELGLKIDKEGVHMINNAFSGTTKGKQPANVDTIRVVKDHHEGIGHGKLEELRVFLNENHESYPLFPYSEEAGNAGFENDCESGIVGLL